MIRTQLLLVILSLVPILWPVPSIAGEALSSALLEAQLCVPMNRASPISYFVRDNQWHYLKGNEAKPIGLMGKGLRAFQSGERLLVFRHGNQPELVVFRGEQQTVIAPFQASGDFSFGEWHEGEIFLGGFAGNEFQVLKVNSKGEVVHKVNFDVPKRQSLYTSGRLFPVLINDRLHIYIPRSMELFELDLDLNLKSRVLVEGMPDDIARFDGLLMAELAQLSDKKDLQMNELMAFCKAHKNKYLRVECMRLIYRNNRLGLLYNVFVLKGYSKDVISEDVLADVSGSDENLILTLSHGKVDGVVALSEGFVKGLFAGNQLLFTHWNSKGRFYYGVEN